MKTANKRISITVLVLVAGFFLSVLDVEAGLWPSRDRAVRLDLERGHVEMQIVRDRGGALRLARNGQNRWSFQGATADLVGGSYTIVLRNRSPERIKVVVGVDGVNVYRKDPIVGRADADTGSILGPWDDRTLRGWQMDHTTAQQFVFSPPEWSEGRGRTDSQIGVVTVQVYREMRVRCLGGMDDEVSPRTSKESEGTMRQAPASPQIGTTSGDDVSSHVRSVTFAARTLYPEAWAEIDYGRWQPQPPLRHDRLLGLHLSSDPNGSRVVAVDAGSEADCAGIMTADVIVRVDTEDNPSVATVTDILCSKNRGEFVFVRLRRGSHELALKIRVG